MKIAIIGASGKSGKHLTAEALWKGHLVTAIVRDKNRIFESRVSVLERDIFAVTPADVVGFDAVIDAFKPPEGQEEQHVASMEHLIRVFERQPAVRLMVVGGAGSLYTTPERTERLMDGEDFPAAFLPTAASMAEAFEKLRASKTKWTYLSPAAVYDPDGPRTGKYTLGDDVLLRNKAGESYVSYADYAVAMIDEAVNRNYVGRRFTVVSEQE
ncbi:MAG: NAD(P)H-binding protein [Deltaproteobacteria bacterium]|nr:NAD(P)H-binding protein [Deltaproteobacteria bacterium]